MTKGEGVKQKGEGGGRIIRLPAVIVRLGNSVRPQTESLIGVVGPEGTHRLIPANRFNLQ